MIIQMDSMIQEAKTVEDLKPLLLLMQKALNTLSDIKDKVKGNATYYDGGIVMMSNDGNYYKVTLEMSGTAAIIKTTQVGKDPAGA